MTFNTFKFKVERRLLEYSASILPDSLYLRWKFKFDMGRPLYLKNPKTYNEKLQWLKLYYKNPEYSKLVDKVEAKKHVAALIGDGYIIPTYGVWNSVDEIDWERLPNQFVIKVTSDSGGIVVCKDKNSLDTEKAKEKLKKGWGVNYYKYNKEYPYKNVKPRIIAEQYMEDESGELCDYKIFCFNGTPKALFVASDRQKKDEETKFDFYDTEWNHLPFTNGHPNSNVPKMRPENFNKMLEIAEKLSAGMPHVRVDLYNVKGKIYFGELTFFHWSGTVPFNPESWDYTFGEWLVLPEKK